MDPNPNPTSNISLKFKGRLAIIAQPCERKSALRLNSISIVYPLVLVDQC